MQASEYQNALGSETSPPEGGLPGKEGGEAGRGGKSVPKKRTALLGRSRAAGAIGTRYATRASFSNGFYGQFE